jgi:hypothetical protein
VVPITGQFDGARYKTKKPMSMPNSSVSVEGLVTRFDVEDGCLTVSAIHREVDNITVGPKPLLDGSPAVGFVAHWCNQKSARHRGS